MSLPPEVRRKGAWGGLGLLGESKEFKLYPPSEFDGLFAVAKFYETCLYLIDFMGPRLMRLEIMNELKRWEVLRKELSSRPIRRWMINKHVYLGLVIRFR